MTEYCEYFLVKYLMEKFNLKKFMLYGTGDTKTFDMLTSEGVDVTGCDLSPLHKHGRAKFYTPDELRGTGQYEGIIAVDVFEHFSEPKKYFELLIDILDYNGILAGMTNFLMGGPIDDGWVRPAGVIEKGWKPGYMEPEGHLCYWSLKSIIYLVEKNNLFFSKFLRTMDNPGESRVTLVNNYVFFIYKDKKYKEFFDELEKKAPTIHIYKD